MNGAGMLCKELNIAPSTEQMTIVISRPNLLEGNIEIGRVERVMESMVFR